MTRPLLLLAIALSGLLVGNAAPDSFDRAVDALSSGGRAAARGDHAALAVSANALVESGATPQAGEKDIAQTWLATAHARMPLAIFRDRPLGPGYRTIGLPRGASAHFDQVFLAGQRARVAVVPLRQARFVMKIVDDAQQNVCDASSPRALCDWVPSFTTRFGIDVRNAGSTPASFVVVVQ